MKPMKLLGLLLALFALAAFAACGDDGGGSDDEASEENGDDGATCDADTAQADVQTALDNFLTQNEAEDKVTTVENGEDYVDFLDETGQISLDEGLRDPDDPTISFGLEVADVTDTSAAFTYDLALSSTPDTPYGLSLTGDAVCVDGEWLISGVTVCDLSAQGPFPPELIEECYTAAGIEF
jgi:hypothetical protein